MKDLSLEVAHSETELEELQRIVDNMELQYNQIAKPIEPPKEFSGMNVFGSFGISNNVCFRRLVKLCA